MLALVGFLSELCDVAHGFCHSDPALGALIATSGSSAFSTDVASAFMSLAKDGSAIWVRTVGSWFVSCVIRAARVIAEPEGIRVYSQ